jgi:hypothetical protein
MSLKTNDDGFPMPLECGSGASGAAAFASATASWPPSQSPLCHPQYQEHTEQTGNVDENKGRNQEVESQGVKESRTPCSNAGAKSTRSLGCVS